MPTTGTMTAGVRTGGDEAEEDATGSGEARSAAILAVATAAVRANFVIVASQPTVKNPRLATVMQAGGDVAFVWLLSGFLLYLAR
jgi:hypothetical protein